MAIKRRNVRVCLCIGAIVSFVSLSFYPSSQSFSTLQELLLINGLATGPAGGGTGGGGEGEGTRKNETPSTDDSGGAEQRRRYAEQVVAAASRNATSNGTTTGTTATTTSASSTRQEQQPEQKQPEQKQPEQKQPEQKQPEQKQPEQKQPEQKQQQQRKPRPPHEEPLNIIILFPDDMRHDSLSAAGTQPVFTPRLDELAKRGIRFAHNCVTTSICWISRATLFTGQYLSRHQSPKLYKTVFYNHWNETWPYLLQSEKNYYVGHIGKWQFHGQEFVQKAFNWTRLFEGQHYHKIPGKGLVHTTDHTRDTTIDFLRSRPLDQNFAVTVAFYPPKGISGPSAFNPKNDSAYLYENITIPPPVEDPEVGWNHLNRKVFSEKNTARRTYNHSYGTPEKYQKHMKEMYRMIHEVDAACGAIIDELRQQGILNKTMVIFSADNGFLQGEHGLGGKWFPYEESIRVPLIVYDPRMPENHIGTVRDEFTLNVDLAETILGAAGLAPAKGMQGRDIADLYLDDVDDWRQDFYYEHPTHEGEQGIPKSSAIVRKDLKYMKWDNLNVESLYDMAKDPNELHDVMDDPAYADVLIELKKRYLELKQNVEEPYYL
jgi:arylsulfatase